VQVFPYDQRCITDSPDAEWKLFYPDATPDFMTDLQRTVALHYDMLECAKIILLESAMFMLLKAAP
jgi:hypothetical protein